MHKVKVPSRRYNFFAICLSSELCVIRMRAEIDDSHYAKCDAVFTIVNIRVFITCITTYSFRHTLYSQLQKVHLHRSILPDDFVPCKGML